MITSSFDARYYFLVVFLLSTFGRWVAWSEVIRKNRSANRALVRRRGRRGEIQVRVTRCEGCGLPSSFLAACTCSSSSRSPVRQFVARSPTTYWLPKLAIEPSTTAALPVPDALHSATITVSSSLANTSTCFRRGSAPFLSISIVNLRPE